MLLPAHSLPSPAPPLPPRGASSPHRRLLFLPTNGPPPYLPSPVGGSFPSPCRILLPARLLLPPAPPPPPRDASSLRRCLLSLPAASSRRRLLLRAGSSFPSPHRVRRSPCLPPTSGRLRPYPPRPVNDARSPIVPLAAVSAPPTSSTDGAPSPARPATRARAADGAPPPSSHLRRCPRPLPPALVPLCSPHASLHICDRSSRHRMREETKETIMVEFTKRQSLPQPLRVWARVSMRSYQISHWPSMGQMVNLMYQHQSWEPLAMQLQNMFLSVVRRSRRSGSVTTTTRAHTAGRRSLSTAPSCRLLYASRRWSGWTR